MKKLLPSLVAVKKITSSVPRETFSELELEQVAKLSLEASGLINPMVLRRTSMQSYEVVDGHFEYYAAVKAKELEPMKGEMIPAFLLEPENEEVLLEQVKVLRQVGNQAAIPVNPPVEPAVNPIPVLPEPERDRQPIDTTLELTPLTEEIKKLKSVVNNLERTFQFQIESLNHKLEEFQRKEPLDEIELLLKQQFQAFRQDLEIKNPPKMARTSGNAAKNYKRMTKPVLISIAKKMGLVVSTKMLKDEIIGVIEQAEAQSSNE
ncbi:hypothetical protein [Oscillatoria sp. HE19RPO]|uniref:ParB N-terminal domain-containing protein n=1 Tax=Oscillatoria sp. HE19RPO TaxID=2954806 RepID=UPI0020C2DCB8|nr:hypothetical protein [Oscillatoria sp. HE19RPO]